MRGQRMRCPNTLCREAFEVREEVHATPGVREEGVPPSPDRAVEPPADAYGKGTDLALVPIDEEPLTPQESATDRERLIPLLPAEVVREHASQEPREVQSWHEPPPVRRPAAGTTKEPRRTPRSESGAMRPPPKQRPEPAPQTPPPRPSEPPREIVEQAWEPPPVRTPKAANPPAGPSAQLPEGGSRRRRMSSLLALLMALAGLGTIGGGAWYVWSLFAATEERQLTEARRDYDEGKFGPAAQRFRQLEKAFPKSEHLALYRFFGDLSEVRAEVQALFEPLAALERLQGFLNTQQSSPLLKDYAVDLWDTMHRLAQGFIEAAREKKSHDLLAKAREVLDQAEPFKPADVGPERRLEADAALDNVEKELAREEARAKLLDYVRAVPPVPDQIEEARRRVKEAGFEQDPEFQKLLAHKEEALRQQVKYVAVSEKIPLPPEQPEPCLLAAPLVAGPMPAPLPNGRVAVALVRGILYGLDQGNGRVLWAVRVGLDTTALPVRLPATETTGDIFLVLSAERNTLRAVDAATGTALWEHRLSAPCLGRPTVIRRRAYVPTVNGRVEELEVIQGHQLGYFELPGQRLTVAAVWQPDTNLLYVPGDARTTYVLDVLQKQCVATLDTGHPAGSLRAAPVLVNRHDPSLVENPENPVPPAFLILAQTDGLGAMRLRAFDVNPEQKAVAPALQPEPRIRGWSWFPAYQDGEKLSFVTDAGVLGLYGINQFRNVDKALFPELRAEFQLGTPSAVPQRAQVVHAEENDFWILANGQLQRLHLDRFAQQVAPVWANALALGTPLHEAQVDETGKVLYLLTQRGPQQPCLATAVRAADGVILWQRQIGVECVRTPLPLGGQVLALDQGGGVFAFDPARTANLAGIEWVLGGQLLARPLPDGLAWFHLHVDPAGTTATLAAAAPSGRQFFLRRIRLGGKDSKSEVSEQGIGLPAALAGRPAVGPGGVLLLLQDGSLSRAALDGSRIEGPNWRSERAEAGAVGFAAWLTPDEFVTTNGLGGLRRWRWPAGEVEFKEVGQHLGTWRIISAPLVLPEDRIGVADARGVLTLFQGPKLKELRNWHLEGTITAGPFLRGDRIGCVVDRRRLVWIDPAEKTPLWDYQAAEPLVGEPQLVGEHLLVADQSGRFVALDPKTGRPAGPGYILKANVAPAVSPVHFGAHHALAPLTDGTLFLLPLEALTHKPEQ